MPTPEQRIRGYSEAGMTLRKTDAAGVTFWRYIKAGKKPYMLAVPCRTARLASPEDSIKKK
jgi:hypothetical protein